MSAPTLASVPEETNTLSSRLTRANVPVLAPVIFRPSRLLWRLQSSVYVLLALSVMGALWPHFSAQSLWWPVVAISIAVLACSLRRYSRALAQPEKILGFDQGWYLEDAGQRQRLRSIGEVVVWQGLVVMRFKPVSGGSAFYLALLPDSATSEDLRRLRVWLRTLLWRSYQGRNH